jgi:hypothetical protein
MSRADGTPRSHTLAGWLISLVIFFIGAVYVCTWWGRGVRWAQPWLPPLLSQYWIDLQRTVKRWQGDSFWRWLLTQFLVALVPVLLCMAFRRRPRDIGLGRFNVLGWWLIALSVLLSIPFGLLIIYTYPGASPLPNSFREAALTLGRITAIVPEHILVCGLFVALMLPGRRLPAKVPVASVQGPWGKRALRWLGLAQPVEGGRVLPWFGLTGASFVAVVTSGILFWLAHLGKANIVEVSLSLPGGVAVAYVTLRCGSVWPAIIAHFTMNLIPGGIAMLFR